MLLKKRPTPLKLKKRSKPSQHPVGKKSVSNDMHVITREKNAAGKFHDFLNGKVLDAGDPLEINIDGVVYRKRLSMLHTDEGDMSYVLILDGDVEKKVEVVGCPARCI